MTVADFAKKTVRTLEHNSPQILTGLAVAGVVSTVVLAVKAAFEAKIEIDKYEKKDNGLWIQASPKEIVQITWPIFVPTAAMGAVTVACILGAQSINNKRTAALIGGYSVMETAFREYREKIVDNFGATKEQQARDQLAQERITANPPTSEVIIIGKGESLCYDTYSDRYFMSDMQNLRRAQNDIVEQCLNEGYASLNDLYRSIGLPMTGLGEEFGWTSEHKLIMQFSTTMSPSDQPCISIGYKNLPVAGYYKMG